MKFSEGAAAIGNFATSAMVLPSAAELRLLEILWRLGEGTIEDVLQASCEYPPRNYKTVQTVLRRMEAKKLVSHRCASTDSTGADPDTIEQGPDGDGNVEG